jgi:DNA-binding XRE family transcriptional regulator
MPFQEVKVSKVIEETLDRDAELKELWNNSRMEYAVLSELVKIRKNKGLSQTELAQMTGNKQQVISRIEKKENSPTLKTVCSILNSLDYEIQLVPKQR